MNKVDIIDIQIALERKGFNLVSKHTYSKYVFCYNKKLQPIFAMLPIMHHTKYYGDTELKKLAYQLFLPMDKLELFIQNKLRRKAYIEHLMSIGVLD